MTFCPQTQSFSTINYICSTRLILFIEAPRGTYFMVAFFTYPVSIPIKDEITRTQTDIKISKYVCSMVCSSRSSHLYQYLSSSLPGQLCLSSQGFTSRIPSALPGRRIALDHMMKRLLETFRFAGFVKWLAVWLLGPAGIHHF